MDIYFLSLYLYFRSSHTRKYTTNWLHEGGRQVLEGQKQCEGTTKKKLFRRQVEKERLGYFLLLFPASSSHIYVYTCTTIQHRLTFNFHPCSIFVFRPVIAFNNKQQKIALREFRIIFFLHHNDGT